MMGRFIRVLSLLAEKGADVPLSSVNWILGLNRQIALGKKLGTSVETQVKMMVGAHKLRLGLGTANAVNAAARLGRRVAMSLLGWAHLAG